ncbi:phospholipase D-like domain-containing protein [Hahella ganghwensis]|uniref:phospholipase D-like domain-containing protein n=1 Tax=Hahella ganghwensis TaxID=286420 RepID=UPI000380EB86|nr:phosphatidylserine/phosphatidylglycerophosphate/cardiolipin synthase family protein [Hahella ganghwensis]
MHRYPLRLANRFQLVVGGDAYLSSLLAYVQSARSEILVEMYLVEQGRAFDLFWAAVSQALEKGVKVSLLLDGYGSRQVLSFLQGAVQEWPNLALSVYNPISFRRFKSNFHRDHRKLIVIDQSIAIISGFGINDEFYEALVKRPASATPPWLDTAVFVRGEVVADWRQLFCDTWNGEPVLGNGQVMQAQGQTPGRVAYGLGWGRQDIVRELRVRIRKASDRIWIVSPYFLTSWRIRRLLRRASRRGLDVRILVPGAYYTDHPPVTYASRRYYLRLLRAGVRLFEYQKSFIHSKIYICDQWVSMGSFNLDHWTYRFNLEANQEVVSESFSNEVGQFYEGCLEFSTEITMDYLKKQRLLDRLLTYLSGKLEQVLLKIIG